MLSKVIGTGPYLKEQKQETEINPKQGRGQRKREVKKRQSFREK
jgi:hypothetical protein